MADNKEITTLHPYMNRNKNRYPNVREENIPDTIQRKLSAGQGINISPENVISATGGDSYTRSETDALLDTKADKTALNNAEKVIPTDLAVKDGKLGLEHDTTWLTNQNAITLGTHLTYDTGTNTLDAVSEGGATLPAGTYDDPFIINNVKTYGASLDTFKSISFKTDFGNISLQRYSDSVTLKTVAASGNGRVEISILDVPYGRRYYIGSGVLEYATTIPAFIMPNDADTVDYDLVISGSKFKTRKSVSLPSIPTTETKSYYLDGTYDKTSGASEIKWKALKKTYNHYIVISDGTASNAIYLLIPSTNNIICSSLTDLNTLLGTENRFIQASGVVTDTASKLPIVAIKWQGSIATSKILTISSEEESTKFTNITDIVEPA